MKVCYMFISLMLLGNALQDYTQCLPLLAFTAFQGYKVYNDIQAKEVDMIIFDGLDLVKLFYLDYKCFKNPGQE